MPEDFYALSSLSICSDIRVNPRKAQCAFLIDALRHCGLQSGRLIHSGVVRYTAIMPDQFSNGANRYIIDRNLDY